MNVSIIIVNWNTKALLLQCLESLSTRSGQYTIEIIVVDNASSDGSVEAVKNSFPQVTVIRNEANFGFAKATNIGLQSSSGRYACLVNSDVVIRDDCIDRLCEYMDQHPSIGISGPRLLNSDLSMQPSCKYFPSLWNNLCVTLGLYKLFPQSAFFSSEHMWFFAHNEIKYVDVLVGAFLMVRRKAIDQVGLLDERFFIYGEETDWCRRFWNAGWKIVFNPQGEAIHFGAGSSSADPGRFSRELYRSKRIYWKKNHSFLTQTVFMLISLLNQGMRLLRGILIYTGTGFKNKELLQQIKTNASVLKLILIGVPK